VGPPAEKGKTKLPKDAPAQQRRMANQMRFYREAFEWRVSEAREAMLRQIKAAGFMVSSLQEESSTTASPSDMGADRLGLKRMGD
jgi:predicted enzyme related to lactoylglutathione lyase